MSTVNPEQIERAVFDGQVPQSQLSLAEIVHLFPRGVTPPIPTKLYNNSDAARYLGVCRQTLSGWRSSGRGPKAVSTPNGQRYSGAEILRYSLEGESRTAAASLEVGGNLL